MLGLLCFATVSSLSAATHLRLDSNVAEGQALQADVGMEVTARGQLCVVDLYEHNNYRGEHLASYQTMNHYGQYFGKLVSSIEDRVSSIRLGPGCLKVKLFDEARPQNTNNNNKTHANTTRTVTRIAAHVLRTIVGKMVITTSKTRIFILPALTLGASDVVKTEVLMAPTL